MDVKRLERVGDDGLELWRPVMKSPLPISAADAVAVFAALRVEATPVRARSELDDGDRRSWFRDACSRSQDATPPHDRRLHGRADGHPRR